MTTPRTTNSLIETKVGAGSTTLLIAGYLSWALFNFVPWLETNLPSELKSQLPILIAWALASFAAYIAPHTHRPDLLPVVENYAATVIETVQPAVAVDVPLPEQVVEPQGDPVPKHV
jgi:hypothetical protein